MEPNKLENQFKEKLNKREINPSEDAWDRLDIMLSVTEKPKQKYTWLYVAASFIGFLLVGTIFFKTKENTFVPEKNKFVIEQSIPAKIDKEPAKILFSNPQKRSYENISNVQQLAVKENKNLISIKDSLTNKNNLNQNQVAEFSIINQKKEHESIYLSTKTFTVDELLASVNKSARLNKSNPNLEVHVNANLLLQQMDNDLEPTFRQSVFSKVADNFKAVKEAVVNRNKE